MPFKDKEAKRRYERSYYKAYYLRNNSEICRRRNERKRQIADWLQNLKATLRCSRCPENDWVCLDFHHVNGKEIAICDALRRGWSRERILREIERCEIVCANCHRKEHRRDVAQLG